MSAILRSVIDFDGGVSQENLQTNFQKLLASRLEWARPDDKKIYEFVVAYFQQHLELPQRATLQDFFERQKDVETTERLKDLEKSQAYIRTNYSHILSSELEDQNKIVTLLKLKEFQRY